MKAVWKSESLDLDYRSLIKLFRENESNPTPSFKRTLHYCLQKLYEGHYEFRDVIVNGFMYSRDYSFLLDLSLERFDDLIEMREVILSISEILGFSIKK